MTALVFDDEWTGERFTYGLQFRPLGISQVPDGWIIQSNRADPRFKFGTVQYPRRLTEREVANFQLVEV